MTKYKNCKGTALYNVFIQTKPFTIYLSFTQSFTDGGSAMQGVGLPTGSNLGFSVLLTDTSTC